jgi:hypothetical protein
LLARLILKIRNSETGLVLNPAVHITTIKIKLQLSSFMWILIIEIINIIVTQVAQQVLVLRRVPAFMFIDQMYDDMISN